MFFAVGFISLVATMATPAPTASASPTPHLAISADAYSDLVDTSANGPGLAPPEASGFVAGSALSPNTPYDLWSSAPLTPGVAGIAQLNITGRYVGKRYDAAAVLGIAYLSGSMQNALYWGRNLMPTINPHLGYTALPYRIAFPTHAGQDDGAASMVCPLVASFGAHDGSWQMRGGFFDLAQGDTFVFMQPQLTNVTPNIGLQTPESLGDGPENLDGWPSPPPGLPLHGLDLTAHRGIASLELTDAALPALPGDSARAAVASLAVDHGEGTRYSASYAHVTTAGAPIATTTFYGSDPVLATGPQGVLPSSVFGGQVETIAGLRAANHLSRTLDSVVEIGRTWYDAAGVLQPGTSRPGGFYHLGFSGRVGPSTIGIDGYRFEARYANAILPYGTAENVWSAAWAWPGVWLKSTYQLVDNAQAPGSNRQGYRLHYALARGPFELRTAFSTFRQIDPATYANMQQAGFVDGFFLPQADDAATLGLEHQYNAWFAWRPRFGDLTIDYANDQMHRDAAPAHPQDAVSYQTPQVVLTFSHRFNAFVVADAGFGRYAMKGSWAAPNTNVDYAQNTIFAGAELAQSPEASILIQLRHAQFAGLAATPGGPSPAFGATTLIVEQRIHVDRRGR